MSTGIMFKATQPMSRVCGSSCFESVYQSRKALPIILHPAPKTSEIEKSVMVISQNKVHWYKFTIVYRESVNLIGYITEDHLLIVYGNIVARVIVHVIFFYMHQYTWCATFEPNVT